jgi:thiamine-phosphate diphosphorylase
MNMPKDKIIHSLYAIVDTTYVDFSEIEETTRLILEGGCKLIQLRAKGVGGAETLKAARIMEQLAVKHDAHFIVNDRVDIAILSNASGIHLGQDDLPPREARELLGYGKIIGLSTHTAEELDEASVLADEKIINYISLGPIFSTSTKKDAHPVLGLDTLRQLRAKTTLPITAIGGITEESLESVINAGANAVALISELLTAKDITAKVRSIIKTLHKASSN